MIVNNRLMAVVVVFAFITIGTLMFGCARQSGGSGEEVFEEVDGVVAVEAEHFYKQSMTEIRKWEMVDAEYENGQTETDKPHIGDASNSTYVKCLPDTRVTHDDKLVPGENFSNEPGKMAVLHYKVYFNTPGKYYVWVRAYSTGTEDNGIHVGLNGQWTENGRRMQWCEGKNEWTWESKQRTAENHCGEPQLIFLEIKNTGFYDVQFSMREDGFAFDKFVLATSYQKPEGLGPGERLKK